MTIEIGSAEPLGVEAVSDGLTGGGLNVAVFSAHASAIEFCAFDETGTHEIARYTLPGRTGPVFHGFIPGGLIPGLGLGTRYGLRAHGPWAPAQGHRFNPARLLLDPHARLIDRPFHLDPALFDAPDRAPSTTDDAALVPKAIVTPPLPAIPAGGRAAPFEWGAEPIYELHVRGFTRQHPDIPPALRGTFAGLAHPASLGYLKRLGVSAVELMPCMAWIDERHLPPLGLANYWGYNPVSFCAPDPRLAPGGWAEIRAAVATLQEAGIAVILDVVLNHTGESDGLGPTLSLRGLDHASWYRLAEDPAVLINDTGCGNTLALDRPHAVRLCMDALRGWVLLGGFDGFRFDLAPVLGRRANGFDPAAPLLTAIEQDPVLRTRVMIAEPWDIGPGGQQLGAFPPRWGEWNDHYRDVVRRFWRGDGGMIGELATRLAGSADIFANRPTSRSINFVAAHDGFTLADLVAYAAKHNLANGEQNRDGTDANWSWNNGVEGPTNDADIRRRRRADERALLATLLCSRGTPMLTMGDEAGRSQGGNNNAYAQDNPTTWFDWSAPDQAQIDFTARLIAIRRSSPALHDGVSLTDGTVAWLRADGTPMADADWHASPNTLIVLLHDDHRGVFLVLHAGQEALDVTLPEGGWDLLVDSAEPGRAGQASGNIRATPRSVLLLRQAPPPVQPCHSPSQSAPT